MRLSRPILLPALIVTGLALTGSALMARPGGWGGPGWGDPDWRDGGGSSLEGRIDVARFRAAGDEALALAHGPIAVVAMPGEEGADQRLGATFEAAVEDRLVHSGYAAAVAAEAGGQLAEVRVVRSEAEPAEQKHKPVSGEMTMGVSNHGSMMGLAIQVDASKPRAALIGTRLETRIRDRASGRVLWEGRAEMYTRAGDERWGDQAIAAKLAQVLFGGFPTRSGEERLRR